MPYWTLLVPPAMADVCDGGLQTLVVVVPSIGAGFDAPPQVVGAAVWSRVEIQQTLLQAAHLLSHLLNKHLTYFYIFHIHWSVFTSAVIWNNLFF